ncbi:Serine/threonine-protein kinase oca2 [Paramyrothecium foliicola]|nr:Serine/threonine-protein kinase oca2 [Paramyrothecium foliicola]
MLCISAGLSQPPIFLVKYVSTLMDTPSSPKDHHQEQNPPAAESPPDTADAPASNEGKPVNVPAVRFSSAVEEIAPGAPTPASPHQDESSVFTEVAADQLKAFSQSIPHRPRALQERRINTFQFEPVSLPASRVPSREGSIDSGRQPTPITPVGQTPNGSPRLAAMASPPLTPAGSEPSGPTEKKPAAEVDGGAAAPSDPQTITPLPSSSSPSIAERKTLAHRSSSSDQIIRRAASADEQHGDPKSHRKGMFAIGPGSVPVSRETSPSRSSASHFYSKPMTPGGDANDPYAKGRRPPQQQHTTRHTIDPRFVFSRKKKGSPSSSKTSLNDKRSSGIFGQGKHIGDELAHSDSASTGHHVGGHGSMADLKRFFRKSGHHRKRDSSPASVKTGTRTPPASRSTQQLPFSDDHGLMSKYGKLGKVLGSGAGGSVRLMRRREDGTVFAVKEFRARHTYETEKEYNKKVTAEFCVGSTLHHGNVIETLDILQEKGRWYEVMEYAPFDLFAIVMTGKMSREEITCCFLQILNGVTYLHSVGLAHRDLKLDNVVVSDKGIMKIIDFGSAHVFKYPFENGTVPAKGIVGSDPYLAPEVYDSKEYDAAAVDIWSLAIIFCCMTLRRFPWKIPRMTDNSFKLFATEPTPGHDPNKLVMHSKSTNDLSSTTPREFIADDSSKGRRQSHHHEKRDEPEAGTSQPHPQPQTQTQSTSGEKKETIKGPWRILRLLPRESRRIIHRMLDLNPATRAQMSEILQEPWVADTVICQQLDFGEVVHAEDHTHILEPPASQQQQPQQQPKP